MKYNSIGLGFLATGDRPLATGKKNADLERPAQE
jgi:hypothetical protein